MMPIYKYKNKEKTMFYVKIRINKRPITKRGFETKNEALLYEATMLNKKNRIIKNVPLINFKNVFFEEIDKSFKISTAYSKKILFNKYIFPFFGEIKICDINNSHIKVFAQHMNKENTVNTNKKIFTNLKYFLDYLTNYGLVPGLNLLPLKVPYQNGVVQTDFDYYTREEFNQFIAVIDSKKFKLLFLLLFNYGLRIGEAVAIRHCDITHDRLFIRGAITNKAGKNKAIYVKPKTTASVRDYPLLDEIKKCYKNYCQDLVGYKKNDFIFKSSSALTLSPTNIRFHQNKYEELSGLRHIRIHEFRHSCATELINNGFKPEQIASWLGHSSSNITMRTYAHLLPSRKLEIADFYNKICK